MNLGSVIETIFQELSDVLWKVDETQVQQLLQDILTARRIVVFGVGRMGLMSRAFVMRLMHLGFNAHMVGDCTTPAVGPGDLLLLNSGSGETQTVFDVAVLGQKAGARLATITARPASRIAKLARTVVTLPGRAKTDSGGPASIQPMTTLNEQSLLLLLDAMVILLTEVTGQSLDDLSRRHCNLE